MSGRTISSAVRSFDVPVGKMRAGDYEFGIAGCGLWKRPFNALPVYWAPRSGSPFEAEEPHTAVLPQTAVDAALPLDPQTAVLPHTAV
jgi:hypothetical protein